MPHVRVHSRKQVHTRLSAKNRTQRLTRRNRGPSLPRPQHGLVPSAKFLLVLHAFIYIHFPVHCEPSTPAEEKNLSKLPSQTLSQTIFHRVFQLLSQMAHVCFHRRKWVHTRLCSKDRTRGHTRQNRGRFSWGCYHYPRSVPHVHEHPRVGYQNGKLCRFWVLAGCTPEGRRKPAGQRCAYACRCPAGVAAPLGCVIFFAFVEIGICTSGAHGFPRVRGMGGITTLGALHVLLKRWTAACQNGSFSVF